MLRALDHRCVNAGTGSRPGVPEVCLHCIAGIQSEFRMVLVRDTMEAPALTSASGSGPRYSSRLVAEFTCVQCAKNDTLLGRPASAFMTVTCILDVVWPNMHNGEHSFRRPIFQTSAHFETRARRYRPFLLALHPTRRMHHVQLPVNSWPASSLIFH